MVEGKSAGTPETLSSVADTLAHVSPGRVAAVQPITRKWAAEPRDSYERALKVIRTTTTPPGFKVTAQIDRTFYSIGIKPQKQNSVDSVVEDAGVGRGVRPPRAAGEVLVDDDGVGIGGGERRLDQRRLAGSRDPGDNREHARRDTDRDVLQIVDPGALDPRRPLPVFPFPSLPVRFNSSFCLPLPLYPHQIALLHSPLCGIAER